MLEELPLSRAAVGLTYEVTGIDGSGFARRRMMDLGLVPGVKVKIVRVAPLGDPIDLEVRGYDLSIRKGEASLIRVRRVTE